MQVPCLFLQTFIPPVLTATFAFDTGFNAESPKLGLTVQIGLEEGGDYLPVWGRKGSEGVSPEALLQDGEVKAALRNAPLGLGELICLTGDCVHAGAAMPPYTLPLYLADALPTLTPPCFVFRSVARPWPYRSSTCSGRRRFFNQDRSRCTFRHFTTRAVCFHRVTSASNQTLFARHRFLARGSRGGVAAAG